jgi:erythromycin esterase-like protein
MTVHDAINTALTPVADVEDCQMVVDFVAEAELALLGEASHGTHESYASRANITKQLILESGFRGVIVEADWPDAYRINRYVRHESNDKSAVEALEDFKRFPTWMWRNTDVVAFVEWLREHNAGLPTEAQAGFYGMDLYALHASMRAVVDYLDKHDPEAARRVRDRFSCFDRFGEDPQAYAYVERFGLESCEDAVVAVSMDMQRRSADLAKDTMIGRDEAFFAEQNARLVKSAEEYYRTMFRGDTSSWNLRDQHMAGTIAALRDHLSERESDGPPKFAIWAHNSHLGDARATQMGQRGELNVGQLMRERFAGKTALIGYTTSHGTVTAASDWGDPVELKRVRPALPDSYEHLFHEVSTPRFFLPLRDEPVRHFLMKPRLERAIGVIYRPDTERQSHYFHASLSSQFDAVLHFDHTSAVRPLEITAQWALPEVPETFPTGV